MEVMMSLHQYKVREENGFEKITAENECDRAFPKNKSSEVNDLSEILIREGLGVRWTCRDMYNCR